MKTIKGNLITLAQEGHFDVIVHGCNCFHTMGGGIARAIREAFPEAYEADYRTTYGDRKKLGDISLAPAIEYPIVIVNAYTQYGYGVGLQVDYDAVRSAFRKVKTLFANKRIGYPKIGAGLGGGDWTVISKIIDDELEGTNHTLVEL